MPLRKINSFRQNLMGPLISYLCALFLVFISIWTLLTIAAPEVELNVLKAISTAFGLDLPERLVKNYSMATLAITFVVILVAVVLMLINVTFEAVVTERLINPKVDLYTSARGVLNKTWNKTREHVLVRFLNFHHLNVLNVDVECVLAVHEKLEADGTDPDDEFIAYFPVKELTPEGILAMKPHMPWTIAIPTDQAIGNSINPEYKLDIGNKKIKSFRKGQKPEFIERHFELMITGIEPRSYARFVKYVDIPIDRLDQNGYELLLHKGSFKSLPLEVTNKAEVEQYV